MRIVLIGCILLIGVLAAQNCEACSWIEEATQRAATEVAGVATDVADEGGPSWSQVEYAIPNAAGEWRNREYTSPTADDCDRAASAVALAWARQKAFSAAGGFVLSYLAKEGITKGINMIWPAEWAIELLRDQIVKRLLDFAGKRFLESAEVRGYDYPLPADKIPALEGKLAGLSIRDYVLVEYDSHGRTVRIIITSDCGGPDSPLTPRLWEVTYQVTDTGQPVDLGEGFRRVDQAPTP